MPGWSVQPLVLRRGGGVRSVPTLYSHWFCTEGVVFSQYSDGKPQHTRISTDIGLAEGSDGRQSPGPQTWKHCILNFDRLLT